MLCPSRVIIFLCISFTFNYIYIIFFLNSKNRWLAELFTILTVEHHVLEEVISNYNLVFLLYVLNTFRYVYIQRYIKHLGLPTYMVWYSNFLPYMKKGMENVNISFNINIVFIFHRFPQTFYISIFISISIFYTLVFPTS